MHDSHLKSLLKKKIRQKRIVIVLIVCLLSIVVAVIFSSLYWYSSQLSALDTNNGQTKTVEIKKGTSPLEISRILKSEQIIKSVLAFDIYTRLDKSRNALQAGTYQFSQKSSLPDIVNQLKEGKVMTFSVTFYPGGTLNDHIFQLQKVGYDLQNIDYALNNYDSSFDLFATKPKDKDLEGYIHGETYRFTVGTPVNEILKKSFSHYYQNIVDYDLVSQFANQGLTLFEGITLASIVQKEVFDSTSPDPTDEQRKVAQVFLLRYRSEMMLGADPTYQYIATKLGLERSPYLDNPYNTRKYTGLPPGPIASPSLSALRAVANPAETDYLYFVSGDDNVTYFAKTDLEHQQNVNQYCKIKCLAY